MMNILRGFISTTLGVVIVSLATLDFYGIIDFGHDHKTTELVGAVILGLILLFVKPSVIEEGLKRLFNRKIDKL